MDFGGPAAKPIEIAMPYVFCRILGSSHIAVAVSSG